MTPSNNQSWFFFSGGKNKEYSAFVRKPGLEPKKKNGCREFFLFWLRILSLHFFSARWRNSTPFVWKKCNSVIFDPCQDVGASIFEARFNFFAPRASLAELLHILAKMSEQAPIVSEKLCSWASEGFARWSKLWTWKSRVPTSNLLHGDDHRWWWSAGLALDQEVSGSTPATSKHCSRNSAILKFVRLLSVRSA